MATVQEKFADIWRTWGLQDSNEFAVQARRKSLEDLKKWLAEADGDPSRVLRANQLLLIDPETAGAANRLAVKTMSVSLQEHWASVGSGNNDLQYMQAMVLAVWPEEASPVHALSELMDANWVVTLGRRRLKEFIINRTARVHRDSNQSQRSVPFVTAPCASPDDTEVDWSEALAQVFDSSSPPSALEEWLNDNEKDEDASPIEIPLGVMRFLEGRTNLVTKRIHSNFQRLESQVKALWLNNQSMEDQLRTASGISRAELDLLWWGQARYCFSLAKPFRRMKNSDEVLLFAAREVAERAKDLEVEPTCAYLCETLHALSQNLDEERTLADWARSFMEALQGAKGNCPAVAPSLAELVSADATGLPVTYLRVQAEQGASLDLTLATLADKTLLPVGERIDRGQWASWVLREWLLDLRWSTLKAA